MAVRTLFSAMMKEEWRMHSTLFGSAGFALFPVILAIFSLAGALALPVFVRIIPLSGIAAVVHAYFLIAGLSVGAFGLLGREVMNRRFGQASLLAYSSRSLPVSERTILTSFFFKDTVYYIIWWVLPLIAGYAVAAPFIGTSAARVLLLATTATLSLLVGISAAFLLSTIYAHSVRALLAVLVLLAAGVAFAAGAAGLSPAGLFFPLGFYETGSVAALAVSLALIVLPVMVSLIYPVIDYPEAERRYTGSFVPLSKRLSWLGHPSFVAKDLIDLRRSEGGIGKIIFSFLFPVAIIWVMLALLFLFIPGLSALMVFSVLLAVVSSTIYNWLCEYDSFPSYSFLPVTPGEVIAAKLESYALLNLVSVAILVAAAFAYNEALILPAALIVFVSLSAWSMAVTVYLTGLYPSQAIYNAPVFLLYMGALAPVLLAGIFLSLPGPLYPLALVVLVPGAWWLVKKSMTKWKGWDLPVF